MSRNPRLSRTAEIQLVNTDFATDARREAAEEIREFYADGVRTFPEMEDRGDWSRSLYQEVYHEHFAARLPDADEPDRMQLARAALSDEELEDIEPYHAGYRDGFKDGVDWALENADRLRPAGDADAAATE